MPQFSYKAYDNAGALVEGRIEAQSRQAAFDALFAQRLFPFEAAEAAGAAPGAEPWWARDILGTGGLSRRNLASFTRELATLVGAELPLDVALRSLASDAAGRKQRQIAEALRAEVMRGVSLSEAMAGRPGTFDAAYVSLVKAGEASGTLKLSLSHLADLIERSNQVRARVASALLYPLILLATAIGAVVLIVAALLPTLVPLFEGSGAELPTIVRVLQTLRWTFVEHWVVAGLAIAATVLMTALIWRSEATRASVDHTLLRLPGAGPLIAKLETARFARTLAALLGGGVPMLAALGIGRTVVRNRQFTSAIGGMIEKVAEGQALRETMRQTTVFPSVAMRLISAGEETGQLDVMLRRVADIFDGHVQQQLERWLGVLTPALTLLIGLGVGALMLSVMDAILSINDLALR